MYGDAGRKSGELRPYDMLWYAMARSSCSSAARPTAAKLPPSIPVTPKPRPPSDRKTTRPCATSKATMPLTEARWRRTRRWPRAGAPRRSWELRDRRAILVPVPVGQTLSPTAPRAFSYANDGCIATAVVCRGDAAVVSVGNVPAILCDGWAERLRRGARPQRHARYDGVGQVEGGELCRPQT